MRFDTCRLNFCLEWHGHFWRWIKYTVGVYRPNLYNVHACNIMCSHTSMTPSVGKKKESPKMCILKYMMRFVSYSLSIIWTTRASCRLNFRLAYIDVQELCKGQNPSLLDTLILTLPRKYSPSIQWIQNLTLL